MCCPQFSQGDLPVRANKSCVIKCLPLDLHLHFINKFVSKQIVPYLIWLSLTFFTFLNKLSKKVKPWSELAHSCQHLPRFECSMKWLEVFLLPLDGMLVHHRSLPRNLSGFPNNLPLPIYTPGWREAL